MPETSKRWKMLSYFRNVHFQGGKTSDLNSALGVNLETTFMNFETHYTDTTG